MFDDKCSTLVKSCLLAYFALEDDIIEFHCQHQSDYEPEDKYSAQHKTEKEIYFIAVLDAPVHL